MNTELIKTVLDFIARSLYPAMAAVLLYAVFVPMSVAGWRAWQRQLSDTPAIQAA